MSRKTQSDAILEYLLAGYTLTPLEAITKFGCMRLGARIWDLKNEGYLIQKEMIKVGDARVASYFMEKGTE